jgi:hypothetical protein
MFYSNKSAFRQKQNKPKLTQFLYQEIHWSFIIIGLYKKGRYINLSPIDCES